MSSPTNLFEPPFEDEIDLGNPDAFPEEYHESLFPSVDTKYEVSDHKSLSDPVTAVPTRTLSLEECIDNGGGPLNSTTTNLEVSDPPDEESPLFAKTRRSHRDLLRREKAPDGRFLILREVSDKRFLERHRIGVSSSESPKKKTVSWPRKRFDSGYDSDENTSASNPRHLEPSPAQPKYPSRETRESDKIDNQPSMTSTDMLTVLRDASVRSSFKSHNTPDIVGVSEDMSSKTEVIAVSINHNDWPLQGTFHGSCTSTFILNYQLHHGSPQVEDDETDHDPIADQGENNEASNSSTGKTDPTDSSYTLSDGASGGSSPSNETRKHQRDDRDGRNESGDESDHQSKRCRTLDSGSLGSSEKPKLLCIFEAYHKKQQESSRGPDLHCHRGSDGENERGFLTFKAVRAHIQRYHTPTQRCHHCWKTFRSGGELKKHLEVLKCRSRPVPPYIMSSDTEQQFSQKRFSGRDEERWWDLFRLLVPQAQDYGLETLKKLYNPYHSPWPGGSDVRRLGQLTEFLGRIDETHEAGGSSSNIMYNVSRSGPGLPDFDVNTLSLDLYHLVHSTSSDLPQGSPSDLLASTGDFDGSINFPRDAQSQNFAPVMTQTPCDRFNTGAVHSTVTQDETPTEDYKDLNNKRLKARIIQLETQSATRASLDRKLVKDMMVDIQELHNILENIIDHPKSLSPETFKKVLNASQVVVKLKDRGSNRLD
ncbi:hypothetical protein F5Y10DRAFT_288236 [Nemania abortiva]|nr:hypothetical protein F5Y10DRAFT_288236 [Nemania abortiva]